MTPTQSPTLASQAAAELPKLPSFTCDASTGHVLTRTDADLLAWGLACYEAGRASRAQSEWISVEDRLPAIGEWANVLFDRNEGDYFDRRDKPRFSVYCAQLRSIDSEGYAHWQKWVMPDGGPIGSLYLVTHWQPLPPAPATLGETK
jgi:hypothetical protein